MLRFIKPTFSARYLSTSTTTRQIDNVLVIGSGLMGSGIAQSCAQSDHQFDSIVLQDVNQKSLDKAKEKMLISLNRIKKKNPAIDENKIVSKITFTQKIEPKSTKNLLIIEAIPELLDLKQKIFKDLSDNFGKDESVILATNTSSLPCSEIGLNVQNKKNFAGLHFFNPVPMMKLVEVINTEHTSKETIENLRDFVKSIQKAPISCKDTPGFIVNRLLLPYMVEAVGLVERGDATAEDVDIAMKLGAGYPKGPFELLDFVGIDTVKFILDGWKNKGADFVKESRTINDLYSKGHFGVKSGKGFYDYQKK